MIAEFKGQNGMILVFDDHIAISRATFGGFVSQGGYAGDRRYFYTDISSFEYKRPTFFANGYFKIIIPGTRDINAKVGILGSSIESAKDPNTIILRAFTSKVGDETDRIYSIIMDKLTKAKKTPQNEISVSNSKMDELKKLGDLRTSGVLTEEEFQKEKERVLNS